MQQLDSCIFVITVEFQLAPHLQRSHTKTAWYNIRRPNCPPFYLLPSVVVSVHIQHVKNDYVHFVQQRCDRTILAVILGQL